MTKGLIFDYGGTLDTGGQHWAHVFWAAYCRYQVPVSEQQFREAYVFGERTLARQSIILPNFTFRQVLEKKMRLQMTFLMPDEETDGLQQAMVDYLYAQTLTETAYSRSVLEQLGARWPMVLVTNFYGNITTVLREFSLDGLFEAVVESAVVGVRKPDPHIFLLGVEALQLKPAEVAVVGDSLEKDILPAHKAGCQTIWLRGKGWGSASAPPEDCQVITCLEELLTKK